MKYRPKDGGKLRYPHTQCQWIGAATHHGAIIENNQQADGSIVIPEVLPLTCVVWMSFQLPWQSNLSARKPHSRAALSSPGLSKAPLIDRRPVAMRSDRA